jgi:hypothetical protein
LSLCFLATHQNGRALGQSMGDVIKGLLHHIQRLLVRQASFFAHKDYNITLCHIFF